MYPKVSVIILPYNRNAYVQEAMHGALAQTRPALELSTVGHQSTVRGGAVSEIFLPILMLWAVAWP